MNWHGQAGERNEKIQLQKRGTDTNAANEIVSLWPPDGGQTWTLWAQKVERQGRESLESGQVVAIQDVRWRINYFEGINARDYRVKKGNKIYDIESITEKGFRNQHELMCKARDNET